MNNKYDSIEKEIEDSIRNLKQISLQKEMDFKITIKIYQIE